MTGDGSPALSVILEWDNPRLQNAGAAPAAVTALVGELARWPGRLELLVVHPEQSDLPSIRHALAAAGIGSRHDVPVRLVDGGPRTYYELKNLGAREAHEEILVFTDSDVEVWPGWLPALVETLTSPGTDLARGQTVVGPTDRFLEQALAAFWLFPAAEPAGRRRAVDRFYANSFACRRQLFLDHPFPEVPGQFRGQCRQLARELLDAGYSIVLTTDARSDHRPPEGWGGLVRRALVEGVDRAQRPAGSAPGPLRWGTGRLRRDLRRVGRRGPALGLRGLRLHAARGVAFVYGTARLAGIGIGTVRPSLGARLR